MSTVRFPNLYLAGAPKCGTTSLANWLAQHPDIFSSVTKEPILFASDLTRAQPNDPTGKAIVHFGSWRTEPFALDATTHYFYSKTAAADIAAASSQPRVYIVARNPADAVHSMYHQLRFNGAENLPTIEEALDAEPKRAESLTPIRFGFPENLLYSRIYAYSENIPRFDRAIGSSQVRVILFDDLIADPRGITRSIFNDLGIDPAIADQIDYSPRNPSKRSRIRWIHEVAVYPQPRVDWLWRRIPSQRWRFRLRDWLVQLNTVPHENPPLSGETRRRLNEQFRAEISWLADYLGRDLSGWMAR